MNPVLTSQEEIQGAVETYEPLLRQLERRQRLGTLTEEEQRLRSLTRLFLIFVGPGLQEKGGTSGQLELIDLAKTDNPTVKLLREKIKISPPEGWVFVRTYPNIQVMPIDILSAFSRENTRGVTILSRYIAMVGQAVSDPETQRFNHQRRAAVLSHELVHAYINAVLAEKGEGNLPAWFHEGCATYLSGSPGGKPMTKLVETPVGYRFVTFEDKAPWDYQQYKTTFDFLEARFGKSGLYDQIRRAVETGEVKPMLAEVPVETGVLLMEQAGRWQRRRQRLVFTLATAVIMMVLIMIWRKLPQERTNLEPEV